MINLYWIITKQSICIELSLNNLMTLWSDLFVSTDKIWILKNQLSQDSRQCQGQQTRWQIIVVRFQEKSNSQLKSNYFEGSDSDLKKIDQRRVVRVPDYTTSVYDMSCKYLPYLFRLIVASLLPVPFNGIPKAGWDAKK